MKKGKLKKIIFNIDIYNFDILINFLVSILKFYIIK